MAVIAKTVIENEFKVHLRKLKYEDRELVRKWLSDPYILKLTFVVSSPDRNQSIPFSNSTMEHYLDMLVKDQNRLTLAVIVNENHVGNVGIKEYSPGRSVCELFIEIGESEYRGVGVGTASIAILLDYAFFTLNIAEMRLEVLEFNHATIHVYEQLGFTKTHRTGWHYDSEGQYWQVWGMSLVKEKWRMRRERPVISRRVKVFPLTKI